MNPRVKNIIDWFSIAIGALTILSNLIVPDSCRLGCMNKALLIFSTVLAVMYLFYAWLIKNDIYTLGDCWSVALLVIVSSIALAYICLKFYDEPVRRWLSKRIK